MGKPSYIGLLNSIAVNEAKGERLLQTWADHTNDPALKATLEFVAIRDGVLNGFCIWFEADLSRSVTLDTGPFSPETHWAQTYVSFARRPVRAGEKLEVVVNFCYDPDPAAISRHVGLCVSVGESELSYLID